MTNDTHIAEAWAAAAHLVDARGSCWEWQGGLDHGGYGKFHHRRATYRVHRLAYLAIVGSIPDGLVLDHLCRNRSCCNPTHLEPVTNRVNIMRGETIAAQRAAQTHCVNGHEFTDGNTYAHPKTGTRTCKECARIRARAYKAKVRGMVAR